jgi:regulator of sigma E protease
MIWIVTALAFVLLLTLLIMIHEWGHYITARLFRVDVEEFGFGLPPRAKTMFHRKGTDFTLNWIPFGGFVRLKGENAMTDAERHAHGSFAGAGFIARASILLAGVFMNFILALVLLTVGFSVGRWIPSWYSSMDDLTQAAVNGELSFQRGVYIAGVLPGSPAAKAGVPKDHILEKIDNQRIMRAEDVIAFQEKKRSVTYTVRTVKEPVQQETYRIQLIEGKSGVEISDYAYDLTAPLRSIPESLSLSLKETVFMTKQTVIGLKQLVVTLVTRARVPEGITGIVGIAVLTHGSVESGFMSYLRLVALLSLSLAILNVLPLPALDGGRLLFVLIEAILRRPLNRRFEVMTNALGFVFLISLIVVITFNDIAHLFIS